MLESRIYAQFLVSLIISAVNPNAGTADELTLLSKVERLITESVQRAKVQNAIMTSSFYSHGMNHCESSAGTVYACPCWRYQHIDKHFSFN
jgi:hypothetical protein